MLSEKEVKNNQHWLLEFSTEIRETSNICSVVSDPTRIKILFLLQRYKELCVTDLSEILNITMGAASHQLSLLEKLDFITRIKMGQMVCYSFNDKGHKILNLLKLKVDQQDKI